MHLIVGLWALLTSSVYATIPYSDYILAPSSRSLSPIAVLSVNGTVQNAESLTLNGTGSAVFQDLSFVTFDYSKNIGGLASFYVNTVSNGSQQIGLSFTESELWISPNGGDATKDELIDEILWFDITGPGNYSVTPEHDRGGFRYLNLYHRGNGTVSISRLLTRFSAMPHYPDDQLRSYTGYFHCNDEKLNLVWYAGAYTNQLCIISSELGLTLQPVVQSSDFATEWFSNSSLLEGHPATLVDGAKRDRLIWPGDLAHSLPGTLLTIGDAATVRATIDRVRELQFPDGAFPYFGAPVYADPFGAEIAATAAQGKSFAYHCHTLTKLKEYHALTNDSAFFTDDNFSFVQRAVDWSLAQLDASGLVNASTQLPLSWAPKVFAGYSTEFNALLVFALRETADLADAIGYTNSSSWRQSADDISERINERLWDASMGLFRENETSTVYPQDGNAFAVIAGVANSSQGTVISKNLADRWTSIGAPAPELSTTISPYVSGFELRSHFLVGQPQRAIDLIRIMWHDYMLKDPRMTSSTFIEGYDVDDTLHYPAYKNDARVSHAHAWATGPITALTNYVAGIHVLSPSHWLIYPQIGDLTSVDAAFSVGSGLYAVDLRVVRGGLRYTACTPAGTLGSISFDGPACEAILSIESASSVSNFSYAKTVLPNAGIITIHDVPGGEYVVEVQCL